MGDYRPIPSVSTIFKIISRMLCSRLSPILPSIIDVAQSDFVEGRSIIDNVLLCQEIINGYDRKHISPRCLAKVDLRKAYDSVNWDFIELDVVGLRFPATFIQWVMARISTTYYTFMLMGNTLDILKAKEDCDRVTRSPLIFLLL
ncbi:hypothetical protein Dimus_037798 [Dionaea muscipula]